MLKDTLIKGFEQCENLNQRFLRKGFIGFISQKYINRILILSQSCCKCTNQVLFV